MFIINCKLKKKNESSTFELNYIKLNYIELQLQDNNINIYPCGIIVSHHAPWLAASPDRKVYQPSMNPPFGLLEIKCPVKPLMECLYLKRDGDGWKLKRNHNYYYQVMMQLAVTGLDWCFLFVWHSDESHLELVHFADEFWQEMKNKLDMFYFNHYLE